MVSAKRTFDSLKLMQVFIPHHDFRLHIVTCPVLPIRNTLHEHVTCANNIVTCKSHLKDVDLSSLCKLYILYITCPFSPTLYKGNRCKLQSG